MNKLILAAFILMTSQLISAASWEKITIPDASCGNGSPYKIFLEIKNEKKLMVEFMGGGACWDFESCFVLPHTIIFPIPDLPVLSVFTSDDSELNFINNHSKIYFPYCTGDIYAGSHIGNYSFDTEVRHFGNTNVIKAINYLNDKKIVNFKKVEDLFVWGASAGAIGSILHGVKFEKLVTINAKKTLIIDSPGLHFGKTFWDKFPLDLINDFDKSFSEININLKYNDGFIAKDMANVFTTYKNWNIGILLGTKDLIMSTVFGNISPADQEKLILSKKGLPKLSDNYKNSSVWIRDTPMHTFLLLPQSAKLESFDGERAIDFARAVYNR